LSYLRSSISKDMNRLNFEVRILLVWFFVGLFFHADAQDTTPPVVDNPPSIQSYTCGTQNLQTLFTNWYNNHGGMTATDDGGSVEIMATIDFITALNILQTSSDTLCGNTQRVRVGFFAEDPAGNRSDTLFADFFTTDTTRPNITQTAQNKTVQCIPTLSDSLVQWITARGGANALDACSPTVTWTNFIWNSSTGGSGLGSISNGPYPSLPTNRCNWSIDVSFFVVDECGNGSATSGRFTVIDTIAPVFTQTPANITVSCDAIPDPATVVANDVCHGNQVEITVSETSTQDPITLNCRHYNYVITRTWTATDPCGNARNFSQMLTVRDTRAPIIDALDTVEIACQVFDTLSPNSLYQVSDNCSTFDVEITDGMMSPVCPIQFTRTYLAYDACGNTRTLEQRIILVDTLGPQITNPAVDQIFPCTTSENVDALFQQWVMNMGNSSASESCGTLRSFAAVPGSYNAADTLSFPGVAPGGFDMASCRSIAGFLRAEDVDFVYYDNCGNVTVTVGRFGIEDRNPPQVQNCPEDVTIDAPLGSCQTTIDIQIPSISDDCIEAGNTVTRSIVAPIRSNEPGNPLTPVEPVLLRIGPFNSANFDVTSSSQIEIELLNVDADEPMEYFVIRGENNFDLGLTSQTPSQCGSTSFFLPEIPAATLNEWLEDGFIEITFTPNIPVGLPVLAINDICVSSRIRAVVNFEIFSEQTVLTTISVNGVPQRNTQAGATETLTLPVGQHDIRLSFIDCALNEEVCQFTALVRDLEPPTITCLPEINLTSLADSCFVDAVINVSTIDVTDGCGLEETYSQTAPSTFNNQQIVFVYDEPTGLHLASNKVLRFTSVQPLLFSNQPARLDVFLSGNFTKPGKFFRFLGEDGAVLGTSPIEESEEDCTELQFTIEIPATLFNAYALDGTIEITAVANVDSGVQGSGINPCISLTPDQSQDGISLIIGRLSYAEARISYEVSGSTTISRKTLPQANTLVERLNVGENQMTFLVSDQGGNESSCTSTIRINDQTPPTAICKNVVLHIPPAGLDDVIVTADFLDNGSRDNCGIASLSVQNGVFTCSDIGSQRDVILIVTDLTGNTSTCISAVRVEASTLVPTTTIGLCLGDTLRLFANAPEIADPSIYNFSWFKDGILISNEENPIILNADASVNGTYRVVVTGFNGCQSEGIVTVNLAPLNTPDLASSVTTACAGAQILLTASTYSGNVSYNWYEGVFPNGVQIGNTTSPNIVVRPTVGTHFYYVIVENTDCVSAPSIAIEINIFESPVAAVNNPFISICEGETISLGTSTTGVDFIYHWSGPDGFTSNLQNPPAITNATLQKQGRYTLIISVGACTSDTVSTQVVVFQRPQTPVIVGENIYCEGSTFTLQVSNILNGDLYRWFQNGTLYTVTNTNSLDIPNAQINLTGTWTVEVVRNNCTSPISVGRPIAIDNLSEIGASNTGPACIGDSITLQTTFVPNAIYSWSGPNGFMATGQMVRTIALSGDYFVTITTSTGCENVSSTTVRVTTPPSITALSNTSLVCMNPGDTIRFSPTIFPTGNYTYQWSGPNGFTSTILNPILTNLDPSMRGQYQLTAFQDGCPSATVSTQVNFNISPPRPVLNSVGPFCFGDTIRINAAPGFEDYLWDTPIGQVETDGSVLVIPNSSFGNAGFYALRVRNGNCPSASSLDLFVEVLERPAIPSIEGPDTLCFGADLNIRAIGAGNVTYEWSGPIPINQTSGMLNLGPASAAMTGTYAARSILGQCKSDLSASISIHVRSEIPAPVFTQNQQILCGTFSAPVEICLDPNSVQPNTSYQFFVGGTNQMLGTASTLCFRPETIFSPGTNLIYAVAQLGQCRSAASSFFVVDVQSVPDLVAEAFEDDIFACDNGGLTLSSRFEPPQVDITWKPVTPGITFSNNKTRNTQVFGLSPGNNTVVLTHSQGVCIDYSVDTIMIFLASTPNLQADLFQVPYGPTLQLDILDNDIFPADYTWRIVEQPRFGTANLVDGFLEFTPDPRYLGSVRLIYEVCVEDCPTLCSRAEVTLQVGDLTNCFAPSIFTPNQDGVNDLFLIPCLSDNRYPNSQLFIFNQWGDQIFTAQPYQNDWAGTYGSDPVPVGTYYYVLDLGDGSKPIFGFVQIQR